MNGTEILLNQIMKSLGLDKDQIVKMASSIGETVVSLKSQLDRIEAKQDQIIKHLGLSTPSAEIVYLEKKDGTN